LVVEEFSRRLGQEKIPRITNQIKVIKSLSNLSEQKNGGEASTLG